MFKKNKTINYNWLKKSISIFLMILIALGSYAFACYVFIPKNRTDLGAYSMYQGRDFQSENCNSLDVMFFGDSNTRFGICPAYLKDNYNIASYSCGVNGQTVSGIELNINKALKKQNLKLIIVDVNILEGYDYGYIHANKNYINAPSHYKTKLKNLRKFKLFEKFKLFNIKDKTRGYCYATGRCKFYKNNKYMLQNKDFENNLIKLNFLKLEKIIKKCKKNNINLILTEYPNPYTWSKLKNNHVENIANKYGISFLDFNDKKLASLFDVHNDILDKGGHLNSYGAVKLTNFMGKYINNNYGKILNKNISIDKTLWNNSINNLKYLDRNNHIFYPKCSK